MATVKDGNLIITLENVDGERLNRIQQALLLAIEEISCSDRCEHDDHKTSTFHLAELLRATMLTDSQVNVAIGGKPYKSDEE
ncbi:MAG: hypothetical protein KF846_04765 [Cyclobacteriaceae bacterium]|nr:hypothetical protein [Cyclobacteriaceae bacterium]